MDLDEADVAHEIALNPDTFAGVDEKEVASTLVHEMAHLWQQVFGKPSRNGYHNKEWADKMDEIGLPPISVPEGKRTGQNCTNGIKAGGPFDVAYGKLKGFKLGWQSRPQAKTPGGSNRNKVKFTCPDCGQNAWAKEGASLVCGLCNEPMIDWSPAD